MPQPLDRRLIDDDVLAEIELTTRLIIAASSRNTRLTQEEIDSLLGVCPRAMSAAPLASA